MSYFFWSKKVSPLKQINAEQLRNLTECLIKYCQDHGNKIHSGTFVLCTGQTNLLEAVEQTYTGNVTFKSSIEVPVNENDNDEKQKNNKSIYFIEEEKIGIDNDETKEGHLTNNGKRIIPKWKRKRMEAIKAKKQLKLPSKCKERYLKFQTPITLMAKRELLRKPKVHARNPISRWYENRYASYNQPPRMVLLPYEATVLPEEDVIEINPDNLEDEDMTENELLLSIIHSIVNDVIKENPIAPTKKKNVYLNKDTETGKMYSFHQKKGKQLMQEQLLKDQNLNQEQLKEMDVFELEMQVKRLTGKAPVYKGVKKLEKLAEKKRKQILIKEINSNLSSRNVTFYNDIIMKRTKEIEEEIAKYNKQLLIDVIGIYINSFYINKKWHLAIKLHSRRQHESKVSKKFVAAEMLFNRIEKVPEEAYDYFCFLMLEVRNLKFHIDKMINGFENKLLSLGWNKWVEAFKLEKIQEEENMTLKQRLAEKIKTYFHGQGPIGSHSYTPEEILKIYPFAKYKYTYKMYNEINSLSKIHGKQFYDGLFSDLKKYGHKDYQKPYFEYRLGREYYINTEETIQVLKSSKIALPIVMAKLKKKMFCAICCERKKRGSIAASKNKNAVTDFANEHCPGPIATLVEKTYIFLAFLYWVITNCWKTPFFIHGYCIGLCFSDRDWRRTRRQIHRVEKLEKERVAFNNVTAEKRRIKRLEIKEQQRNNELKTMEEGDVVVGEGKAE